MELLLEIARKQKPPLRYRSDADTAKAPFGDVGRKRNDRLIVISGATVHQPSHRDRLFYVECSIDEIHKRKGGTVLPSAVHRRTQCFVIKAVDSIVQL